MSSQPTTQQPAPAYSDSPADAPPSERIRHSAGSTTTKIGTNTDALSSPPKVLRSDMTRLGHTLKPHFYSTIRALRGDFTIRDPYNVQSLWLRRLINTITIVAGLFIAVTFFFQYELEQSGIAVLMGIGGGAGVMFAVKRPILSWQLFLVTMVLAVAGFTYNYGPYLASHTFVIVMAIRLTVLSERPYRWIVPLTSAGIVALVNIIFFANPTWLLLVPIMALIAFVIDSNRTQREAIVSRDAAEQAAAAAGEIAAEAGQIAAEAKTEVIALGNREAILKERSRIARDLHDVVAHHMSMVVVRAQTARYRIENMPKEITEELDEIADLARQSLSEVRDLLSVLRSDSDVILTPQPTLADLPDLMTQAQDSGMKLMWEAPVELPKVSSAVSIASYRVIQEALANVRRHAHGAETEVCLMAQGSSLIISVHNEPAPEPEDLSDTLVLSEFPGDPQEETAEATVPMTIPEPATTPEPMAAPGPAIMLEPESIGHGLLGVQERVHAVGGIMSAGATSVGGYLLYVRLPLDRQELSS